MPQQSQFLRVNYAPDCAANERSEARAAVELVEIEPKRRHVGALQKWRLRKVVEYIDSHLAAKITLSDLAAVAGLSQMYFASQFRTATGLRPHTFLLKRRIGRAEELLLSTTMPIVEIALAVGFQTQAHFTTVFTRFVGDTPRRWRAISAMRAARHGRYGKGAETTAAVADQGRLNRDDNLAGHSLIGVQVSTLAPCSLGAAGSRSAPRRS